MKKFKDRNEDEERHLVLSSLTATLLFETIVLKVLISWVWFFVRIYVMSSVKAASVII
jgi:hypothetical protein